MSKPSLAFYMHDLSGGGVERMRLVLIDHFLRAGHAVRLILHRRQGPLASLLPIDLPVHELGGASTLADLPHLVSLLRRFRPHVLLSSLDHNNIVALLAGRLARTPTVICQHNALSAEAAAGARFAYRAVPVAYRVLHQLAAGIVAVSQGVADDLAAIAGIPGARITVIHNPVLDSRFQARDRAEPPHCWLADPALRVFVFAGRLVPQKDPATLLRAFARLADANARLIVLGEGPLRPELTALTVSLGIADRVAWPGFVPDPLPWFDHAEALVLPSRHEGFGNVLVEALGCGTPVIAADCPHGPAEILENGRHGLLFPVGNDTALAGALERQVRALFPEAMCRHRAAAFTLARCVDRHTALIEGILSERDRRAERRVFGLALSPCDAAGIADQVLSEPPPPDRGPGLVVTPNIDHVRLLRRRRFRVAYTSAAIACADGFPVAAYARWRGVGRRGGRVTGCDITHALLADTRIAGRRVTIIVESWETADAIASWHLHTRHPALTVLVAAPGLSHDNAARDGLALAITRSSPDVLLMTLGAPTSEMFVAEMRDALPACWALCVGQAVKVELGLVSRGSPVLHRLGLEWAWRLKCEPRRLSRRYLISAGWFPIAILKDRLGLA